jgi:hypothetical protein
MEPTDAEIIRYVFLELNQSQHVSGIIMPIIRRTRTRLVKTAVEQQLSRSAHCLNHGSIQPQPAQPSTFT